MKCLLQVVTALSFLGFSPVWADTITTRDHVSVNGSLIKMTDDQLTIMARYRTGNKTLSIKITDAEIIEFNNTTFNSGAPPKELGIGPPLDSGPVPAHQRTASDTIFLRGSHKACKLIGIDTQFVHCAGKDGEYPRRIVLRITLETE
jgi:hypothetical protein